MQRRNAVRLARIGVWMTGLVVVCWASGVALPAEAGLRALQYSGTLGLRISTLPGVTGAGGATATAITQGFHLTTLVVPGGAIGPINASLPVTTSGTIQSVRFTGVGNLSATITGISGGPPLGYGAMGISGLAKICLFGPGACIFANVPVPLSPTASGAGLGIGGTQIVSGAVALTMQHSPWTVGQPVMTIHTPMSYITTPTLPGGYANPASATAANSGVLQLVTASKVFTSLTSAFPELPVTAILTLHMVPEPGTLLLVTSGVVGLCFYGRRQRRL